jgi:hypothetical protein
MDTLYEMTMFLAIASIAIVATVFVIAASLLRSAIEESSRQQNEIIAGLQQKLDAAKTPEAISSIQKDLKSYKKISQRYGLLTVKGTVRYPAIFFLASLVLAGAARYTTDFITNDCNLLIINWIRVEVPLIVVADVLWGLSLVALILGFRRIYQCLKVIEDVAGKKS